MAIAVLCFVVFERRYFAPERKATRVELHESEAESEREQETKRIRSRGRPYSPSYQRRTRKALRSKANYFSTKTRNVRALDQKKIRRMCINL